MKNTPRVVIVEEHHEAFYVWCHAVAEGRIPASGNTLLHVDEHADTSTPRLRERLASIHDLPRVRDFVYGELDISSFIWPAVYHGLFDRMAWLRRSHAWGSYWRAMHIRAAGDTETQFIVETMRDVAEQVPQGARRVNSALMTPSDEFATPAAVLLDIDLDYFCSNQFPNYGRPRVEITREACDAFENDPYHLLRIAPGIKARTVRENGRCYLAFNDYDAIESDVDPAAIETAMDEFFGFLERSRIVSPLITVCRSLHSGYLPRAAAGLIEPLLLSRLRSWCAPEPLEIAALADLTAAPDTPLRGTSAGCRSHSASVAS